MQCFLQLQLALPTRLLDRNVVFTRHMKKTIFLNIYSTYRPQGKGFKDFANNPTWPGR